MVGDGGAGWSVMDDSMMHVLLAEFNGSSTLLGDHCLVGVWW